MLKYLINGLINYSQENLANVLYKYGELKNSRRIANEIIDRVVCQLN